MKKVGSLVGPQMTALDQLAARAPNQPREITALEYLAYTLNGIPHMDPQVAKGWRKAEEITTEWLSGTAASMRQALDDFNGWAKHNPVSLSIGREDITKGFLVGAYLSVGVLGLDPEQIAIWLLTETFFKNGKRGRFKRCPECRTWFVDKTRNGSMIRCSTSCTNKWWTLDRRRKAGHQVQGSTRKAKRRATP